MNQRTALGLMMIAPLCTGVVLSASIALAQQNSVTKEQLVQPEIVKVSLRVDGNPTDVVTHIYKPSTPGVTAFPVVIYSHGRPFNPSLPNTVARHAGGEGQMAVVERALQPCEILGAEDDRERLHWKQKRDAPTDPARAVARQSPARDEAVHVQMISERLTPGVQDGGDADGAAEVAGIPAKGEQRLGRRPEQERVEDARVALRERIERVGQREDHMEVGNRQELRAAGLNPSGTRLGLAHRTVPIATRVEGQPGGPTVVTPLPTPAQQGGAARRDRAERPRLNRREPMRVAIGVAVGTHEVGEGEAEGRDRGRRP